MKAEASTYIPPAAAYNPAPPRPRRSKREFVLAATTAVLCYQLLLIISSSSISVPGWFRPVEEAPLAGFEAPFNWLDITPSTELEFTPCYKTMQCARLELPLDYWNGTYPDKSISLAVVRVPAKVPVTDPRYGGPILVNPGGPGGSGTAFTVLAGEAYQTLADFPDDSAAATSSETTTARHYDIIGFDPRGIGFTLPRANCFADATAKWAWELRKATEGILGSSDAALGRLWSIDHAFGADCNRTSGGDDIKRYITTVSVARDMLELTERLGQWREREAARLLTTETRTGHRENGALPEVPDHLRYKPGKELLQYWGFSYGTLLGNTFASMYPSRVGRAVLDGVVDAVDYTAGLWYDNLVDTEKAMSFFYKTCAAAGPALCPLASSSSGNASAIQDTVSEIIASLYHHPLPIETDIGGPEILTYSDLRILTFGALYFPNQLFPLLASFYSAIQTRNAALLADFVNLFITPAHIPPPCPRNDNDSDPVAAILSNAGDAQVSVICGDADDQTALSLAGFRDHWRACVDVSPTGGDFWAQYRMQCVGWEIKPLHRFTGPFGTSKKKNDDDGADDDRDYDPQTRTAAPVLFVANTADPVTPLRNARRMRARHPASYLLTQHTAGHCSMAAFSACTVGHLRRYWRDGVLDRDGDDPAARDAWCEVDQLPFGLPGPEADAAGTRQRRLAEVEVEVERAREAQGQVQRALVAVGGGLGLRMNGGGVGGGRVNFAALFDSSTGERI